MFLIELKPIAKNSIKFTSGAVSGIAAAYWIDYLRRPSTPKEYAEGILRNKTIDEIGKITSDRADDIERVRRAVDMFHKPFFPVVRGPNGVGKTTLIKTALKDKKGVVVINPVTPGTGQDEIVSRALRELVGEHVSAVSMDNVAMSTIKAYRAAFNESPLIIIPVTERSPNKEFADVPEATRILVENYNLRVIVDAAENSLPHEPNAREESIEIEPMSDELMQQLSTFKDFFEALKAEKGALEVVLAFCAGRPLNLLRLDAAWKEEKYEKKKPFENVKKVIAVSVSQGSLQDQPRFEQIRRIFIEWTQSSDKQK